MKRRHNDRGIAAIELALLLPVLLTLLGGVFEAGRALGEHQRLCQAVRLAARHLSTGDAADAQRQQQARNLAVYGNAQGTGAPLLPGLTATAQVAIFEPQTDAGVRLVATGQGPLSLVGVSVSGYVYTPVVSPVFPRVSFHPVSLTLPYQFF